MINVVANKTKINFLAKYSVLFSALFPTILILKYSTLDLWNVKSVLNWRNWLTVFAIAAITAWIVSRNKVEHLPRGKELFQYALDGIMMEIPQRMMMQSFVYTLLLANGRSVLLAPVITAVIWCISICIQCVIMQQSFDKNMAYELLSSFVFSVGVGYVLMRTEFIGFTMMAHFLERIFSTWIRKWIAERCL